MAVSFTKRGPPSSTSALATAYSLYISACVLQHTMILPSRMILLCVCESGRSARSLTQSEGFRRRCRRREGPKDVDEEEQRLVAFGA